MEKTIIKLKPIHQLINNSPNTKGPDYDQTLLKVPKILPYLNIDWQSVSENLEIDISKDNLYELEFCLNKIIYSDNDDVFEKNFGIKTINLRDIGLTSINQISDDDLVVDQNRYAFSYFDLKRLDPTVGHPYLGQQGGKMGQLKVDNRLMDRSTGGTRLLFEYFEHHTNRSFRSDSSQSMVSDNLQDIDDPILLENIFEHSINHDFYTVNLIFPYKDRKDHLDYSVALLYYILAIIDDFGQKYLDCLINDYFQATVDKKYLSFLRNYIYFLDQVKNNYNIEKFQYVCIIIVKILQYRLTQIQDGEALFKTLKPYIQSNYIQEFYWSILLDRVNYLHAQQTSKISLINISIDNIFSNTELANYYYTLMVYLHTKYMDLPSRENGTLSPFLNHYKQLENYNYLDLLQYFSEMAEYVNNDEFKHLKNRFQNMIRRYYLKNDYITINRDGLVID